MLRIRSISKQKYDADRYSIVPVNGTQMRFYYVYVLHSINKNFIYIGYSEDVRSRFSSHNEGKNKSTKAFIPLELIHYEAYKNMEDAKRREFYLKSNRGKTTLKTMLKKYFENL